MRQVFRIDENGFYVEPVLLEKDQEVPNDCSEAIPLEGLYKAKFVNGEWVEGLTQEELDTLKNILPEPEPLETLKKQQELMQQAIDDLILGGMM
jgi:hypothetical protein